MNPLDREIIEKLRAELEEARTEAMLERSCRIGTERDLSFRAFKVGSDAIQAAERIGGVELGAQIAEAIGFDYNKEASRAYLAKKEGG